MPAKLHAIQADITTLAIDAIVNAANPSLLGDGGVSGAILRAGGRELVEACRRLGGCASGDAKLTAGYHLPARFVIHAVGPVWHGGGEGEAQLLSSCYRRSCEVAATAGARSLAFPSISTGIFGYPFEQAASIAVNTVRESLSALPEIESVVFCCFSRSDLLVYRRLLAHTD
ncbi:O-acetyl-ADP-ribose deacetylase [Pseudomonas oryzae]|uniref:O-acetyl-ADP-ribose deacetylase (Regulator of RNase III), contains Macro domain n=1 Tax=Pseudomonas oryzae TaxID=1392877 RepID=A0A1H1MSA3_9PSED|nr:O-acetyl-ADP-ribose deacetylase [Pseudomonas oryzae]SDR89586.1 O-acetyl-ADP-ribose deacetylase (regulator of RNase III), contains Macro domain [Pseudomonas oryzae]